MALGIVVGAAMLLRAFSTSPRTGTGDSWTSLRRHLAVCSEVGCDYGQQILGSLLARDHQRIRAVPRKNPRCAKLRRDQCFA